MSLNTQLAGWIKLTSDVESLQSTQAGNALHYQLPDGAILNVRLIWRCDAPCCKFDEKSSRQLPGCMQCFAHAYGVIIRDTAAGRCAHAPRPAAFALLPLRRAARGPERERTSAIICLNIDR